MSQLRITSSILKGGLFQLDRDYITVGRDPDNTIQLVHTSVSKHHAMVTIDNGDFKLWDLHSTNGLVVNGEKTVIRHLRDGDRIILGEVELRFEQNGIVPATPTKPVTEPISSASRDTQPFVTPLPPLPKSEPTVVKPTIEIPKTVPVLAKLPSPPTDIAGPSSFVTGHKAELAIEPPPPAPKAEPMVIKQAVEIPKPIPALTKPPSPPTNIGVSSLLVASSKPELSVEPPPPPPPTPEQIRSNLVKTVRAMNSEKPSAPPPSNAPILPEPKPVPEVTRLPALTPSVIVASIDPPKRFRRSSLICAGVFATGLCLFGLGYRIKEPGCMFVGLMAAVTGFICLLFALGFGNIVAPARKRD